MRLYFWNQELAAVFLGPLSVLEVATRNAMHEQLSAEFGDDWILDSNRCRLLPSDRENFDKVIDRLEPILRKRRQALNPDAVVAGANFGDWVSLLGSGDARSKEFNYEKSLWEPALQKAFPFLPSGMRRKELHGRMNALRSFRNRVAHHEPIFHRNLNYVMEDIVEATGYINHDAATLIREGNQLKSALEAKDRVRYDGECVI